VVLDSKPLCILNVSYPYYYKIQTWEHIGVFISV
jgi:hypothetical protein